MKDLNRFYFSKSALDTYNMCALRFRRIYIDGFYWGSRSHTDEETMAAMKQGRDFHLLAHRYFSGIPGSPPEDEKLASWMENLKAFMNNSNATFLPEYELKYFGEGMKIMAKYDLIALDYDGKITIYDWKTDNRRLSLKQYDRCFQTVLYMYCALKCGTRLCGREVQSESVRMVYFNPEYPSGSLEIFYDDKRVVRDREILDSAISSIMNTGYDDFKPCSDAAKCSRCEFNYLCNGRQVECMKLEELDIDDFDMDDIQAIII